MICTRIGRPADKPSTTLGFRVFPVRREWSAMEEFYKPGRPVWRKRNAEHRPEAHRKYVSSLIKTLEELEEKTPQRRGRNGAWEGFGSLLSLEICTLLSGRSSRMG